MAVLEDIKQSVVLSASAEKVWKLVSTAEGIATWFMPSDLKLEEGYAFTIQSPFGPSPCKVTQVDAPNSFSFDWDTDGWLVTILVKEITKDQTEVTIIHGGWKEADHVNPKNNIPTAAVHANMTDGWLNIVQNNLKNAIE